MCVTVLNRKWYLETGSSAVNRGVDDVVVGDEEVLPVDGPAFVHLLTLGTTVDVDNHRIPLTKNIYKFFFLIIVSFIISFYVSLIF